MLDTTHSRALGDIILERLGIPAWTLTNYSSDKRTFEIIMEIPDIDNKKLRFITESDATHTLGGNETRIFHVSKEDIRGKSNFVDYISINLH